MGTDVAGQKRRLRGQMAELRRGVSPDRALAAGEAAARLVLDACLRRGAGRVALYAALPDELPTRPLFEGLAARGIARLLPRATEAGALIFEPVECWDELCSGAFGVLEPPLGPGAVLGEDDLVVLPGVAFDTAGHRLGRGRGYYDRTFPPARAAAPTLVGFAYEVQVVHAVPCDSRDREMDAIVTERRVRWIDVNLEGTPIG